MEADQCGLHPQRAGGRQQQTRDDGHPKSCTPSTSCSDASRTLGLRGWTSLAPDVWHDIHPRGVCQVQWVFESSFYYLINSGHRLLYSNHKWACGFTLQMESSCSKLYGQSWAAKDLYGPKWKQADITANNVHFVEWEQLRGSAGTFEAESFVQTCFFKGL